MGSFAKLSERVKDMAAKNKATEKQEVDCLEVVAKEFTEEIENMSLLETRLSPEEPKLREAAQPKKIESKSGTSRPRDA